MTLTLEAINIPISHSNDEFSDFGSSHGMSSSSPLMMSPPLSSASLMSSSSFATSVSDSASISSPLGSDVDSGSVLAASSSSSIAPSSNAGDDESTMAIAATVATAKLKPHKCDVCGACFARKVHLQRHSLRHQVCKPYCCERCGKCFSRQDSLVRHHRLLHEGGREANQKNKAAAAAAAAATASTAAGISSAAASKKKVISSTSAGLNKIKKRSRQRNDSVTTTGSTSAEEDIDASAWTTTGHGPRRDTASSVSSLSTVSDFNMSPASFNGMEFVGMAQPHQQASMVYPNTSFNVSAASVLQQQQFDMSFFTEDVKAMQMQQPHAHHAEQVLRQTAINMPHLLTMLPNMQQQPQPQSAPADWAYANNHSSAFFSQPQALAASPSFPTHDEQQTGSANVGPMLDLSSLMLAANAADVHVKQPFSGAASNKALNATLLSGDEYPSPAIHGGNLHLHHDVTSTVTGEMLSGFVNGMPSFVQQQVFQHPNAAAAAAAAAAMNMSADNWDGLMRSLSSHVSRPVHESLAA